MVTREFVGVEVTVVQAARMTSPPVVKKNCFTKLCSMTKWDNNCSVVLLHDQKIITDFNDNVKEVLKIINLNQLYSSHHMYINLLLEIRFVEKITNIKIN